MRDAPPDPRGLIREAYRIDGLALPEARAIFLDWALGLPAGEDPRAAIALLMDRHGAAEQPEHPMSVVLREGLEEAAAPRRRGGRAARVPTDES